MSKDFPRNPSTEESPPSDGGPAGETTATSGEEVGDESNPTVAAEGAAMGGTSREAERVQEVRTTENIDSTASAERTKQVGGGHLDAAGEARRPAPGSGKGPHPAGEDPPEGSSERAARDSRPTGDVGSSRVEGADLTDPLYRRMFFLRHFQFDDIIVHINGQTVLIDAKHGDHADEHGLVSRAFVRTHQLPEHVIADKLVSYFTGDGVLVIEAPCSKIP